MIREKNWNFIYFLTLNTILIIILIRNIYLLIMQFEDMIVKKLYFVLNIIKYFVRHFNNPESEILKIISDSFVRKFFFLIIPQYYFPSPCYLTETGS